MEETNAECFYLPDKSRDIGLDDNHRVVLDWYGYI